MLLYLITHAHTQQVSNVAAEAWRLSARGLEEAAQLANEPFWADVDRVVVSAEPKTLMTVAEVVERRKLPVWSDSRFDELRRSGWIENYATQVEAVFAEPERSVLGWEPAQSVQTRVRQGVDDLRARFAGETVALVSHGLALSLLRSWVLGEPKVNLSDWRRLTFGSYALISLDPLAIVKDFPLSKSIVR